MLLSGGCRKDAPKLYWEKHGDSMRSNGKVSLNERKRFHNEWKNKKNPDGVMSILEIIRTCQDKTRSNKIYFQSWS